MKKYILILVFFISIAPIFAQNPEARTLLNSGWINNVNSYAALETKYSQVDNGMGVFIGAKAGVLVNHSYSFSLAGYVLIPQSTEIYSHYWNKWYTHHIYWKNNRLTGGYGGFLFEYFYQPNNLFHVSASSLIGFGAVKISPEYYYYYWGYPYYYEYYYYRLPARAFFVFEPGLTANANLTNNFKASLGVSYRLTPGTSLKYHNKEFATSKIFDGLSLNIGISIYELF